jgi:hypothetical protein
MFSIAIVLFIIVFPVLIPAAVSSVGGIADARQRRRERLAKVVDEGNRPVVAQPISQDGARQAVLT